MKTNNKWMKTTQTLFMGTAVVMATPVMAIAESAMTVKVNDVIVDSPENYLSNEGKTYVDVESFVKVTGVSYTYNEANKTLAVNGKAVDFEVKNGKKLAYVRSLAEAAGASGVEWDAENQTVIIKYDKKLSVYGDVVSHLAGCVLQNRFAVGDSIIFRMKAINPISGQLERNAKLQVHLSTGEVLDMKLGGHPPDAPNAEYFWTVRYDVTEKTPKGTLNYYVTAESSALKGEYRPFNVMPSLITIVSEDASAGKAPDTPVSN